MFEWLRKLFHRETDLEKEERFADEVIKESNEIIEESYEREFLATVIRYIPSEDDNRPSINVLVDDFSSKMLPEIGSIIWISSEDGMRPHKVIRFDFFENGNIYDSMRTYIVVEDALTSDIIPNPRFV